MMGALVLFVWLGVLCSVVGALHLPHEMEEEEEMWGTVSRMARTFSRPLASKLTSPTFFRSSIGFGTAVSVYCSVGDDENKDMRVSRVPPSSELLERGDAFASMALAAYSGKTTRSQKDNVGEVEKDLAELLDAHADISNVEIMHTYRSKKTRTFMYAARFDLDGVRTGALVFRGTVGDFHSTNWEHNFNAYRVTEDASHSRGLWESYMGQRKAVLRAMLRMCPEEETSHLPGGLYLVGHSLGGAMATFAAEDIAAEMHRQGKQHALKDGWVKVVTFGEPRGYSQISSQQRSLLRDIPKYRFIAAGDPVPSFPNNLQPFMHQIASPREFSDFAVDTFPPEEVPQAVCNGFVHTGVAVLLKSEDSSSSFQAIRHGPSENFSGFHHVITHAWAQRKLDLQGAHSMENYLRAIREARAAPE